MTDVLFRAKGMEEAGSCSKKAVTTVTWKQVCALVVKVCCTHGGLWQRGVVEVAACALTYHQWEAEKAPCS